MNILVDLVGGVDRYGSYTIAVWERRKYIVMQKWKSIFSNIFVSQQWYKPRPSKNWDVKNLIKRKMSKDFHVVKRDSMNNTIISR